MILTPPAELLNANRYRFSCENSFPFSFPRTTSFSFLKKSLILDSDSRSETTRHLRTHLTNPVKELNPQPPAPFLELSISSCFVQLTLSKAFLYLHALNYHYILYTLIELLVVTTNLLEFEDHIRSLEDAYQP